MHPIIVYLWTWNTIEFQSLLRLKLVEPIINVAFGIMCEDMDSEDFDDTEAEANTAPQFASQVCCLYSQFISQIGKYQLRVVPYILEWFCFDTSLFLGSGCYGFAFTSGKIYSSTGKIICKLFLCDTVLYCWTNVQFYLHWSCYLDVHGYDFRCNVLSRAFRMKTQTFAVLPSLLLRFVAKDVLIISATSKWCTGGSQMFNVDAFS